MANRNFTIDHPLADSDKILSGEVISDKKRRRYHFSNTGRDAVPITIVRTAPPRPQSFNSRPS